MSSKQWLIVGISGITCSGKTTLSKRLHQKLKNSVVIHQDDYCWPIDDSRHTKIPELNHINWELMSSMDMDKMRYDIFKLIESSPNNDDSKQSNCKRVLILDGFLLFRCKVITNLCNLKYFMTITKELCWKRRAVRNYQPADVPGYFEQYVWPESLKYKDEVMNNAELCKTVKFIDGSKDEDEVFQTVYTEIKEVLSRWSS